MMQSADILASGGEDYEKNIFLQQYLQEHC